MSDTINGGRDDAAATGDDAASIAGERHIPSVNRVRSLQSRVTNVLTIGVLCVVALAMLGWYYSRAFAQTDGGRAAKRRAATQTESFLPALTVLPEPQQPRDTVGAVLGAPPPPPTAITPVARSSGGAHRITKPDRLLTGPVFARQRGGAGSASMAGSNAPAYDSLTPGDELSPLLQSHQRTASTAQTMMTPRWMLPPGATIDCTLETAINSSLPGMTRCVTATDTWSADGSVVLLERGSQIVGETRGQISDGVERIFVVWTQARTPAHVIVPLDSPGTDALGRSGLAGDVNYHFVQRFSAALMVSVIDGAVRAATRDQDGAVIEINPSTSRDVMTEILRHTIKIRPTVGVHQGSRVQIFVARPVNFGAVYGLRNNVPG